MNASRTRTPDAEWYAGLEAGEAAAEKFPGVDHSTQAAPPGSSDVFAAAWRGGFANVRNRRHLAAAARAQVVRDAFAREVPGGGVLSEADWAALKDRTVGDLVAENADALGDDWFDNNDPGFRDDPELIRWIQVAAGMLGEGGLPAAAAAALEAAGDLNETTGPHVPGPCACGGDHGDAEAAELNDPSLAGLAGGLRDLGPDLAAIAKPGPFSV